MQSFPNLADSAAKHHRAKSIRAMPVAAFVFPNLTEDEAIVALRTNPAVLPGVVKKFGFSERLNLEATLSEISHLSSHDQFLKFKEKRCVSLTGSEYREMAIHLVSVCEMLLNPTDNAGFQDLADAVRTGLKLQIEPNAPALAAML